MGREKALSTRGRRRRSEVSGARDLPVESPRVTLKTRVQGIRRPFCCRWQSAAVPSFPDSSASRTGLGTSTVVEPLRFPSDLTDPTSWNALCAKVHCGFNVVGRYERTVPVLTVWKNLSGTTTSRQN